MCGRYSITADIDSLDKRVSFSKKETRHIPRFNVSPAQDVLTLTSDGTSNHAQFMKWGLIPFWAKDPSIGIRMINARAETIEERPAFRQAFQQKRCLILADGFYEWINIGKTKIPMRITLKSDEPFGFAGIWDSWKSPSGEIVTSCSIITTTPNNVVKPIHNRMPVIIPEKQERLWLEPTTPLITNTLKNLLTPYPAEYMKAYEVSSLVNSGKIDSPDIIAPQPL